MTDSGSFDSGDLVSAADHNNLSNLINAKCVEAGISTLSWGASQGGGITASYTNSLIAKYQELWNLSSNKPGTMQAQVSAGSLIYGSLFQNMWTQLGQMEFNPWPGWDEAAQSGMARSKIFCVMFDATTAGAADVGEGAGLSGSDATFNCDGSPAAVSGYGRYSNGGGWYFPQAVADLTLQPEWTLIFKTYQFPSIGVGSNQGAFYLYANHDGQYTYLLESGGPWQLNGRGGAYAQIQMPGQSGWCYHYYWRMNGYFGTGWSTTKCNSRADIPNKSAEVAAAQFTTQNTGTKEIGRWPGWGAATCYYKYLVVARTALLA